MRNTRHLLDVNVLLALLDKDHVHHRRVESWFRTPGLDWGVCAFTEAGFLRVASNPQAGDFTMDEAIEALGSLPGYPGFRYWPLTARWTELSAPFLDSVFGHQQVTGSFLLGLAVRENGVLVTFDKAIRHLAGDRFAKHILLLQ